MPFTLPSQQTTIARLSQIQLLEKNKEMPQFDLQTVSILGSKDAPSQQKSKPPARLLVLSGYP